MLLCYFRLLRVELKPSVDLKRANDVDFTPSKVRQLYIASRRDSKHNACGADIRDSQGELVHERIEGSG